jgi:DNA-damage-inducible protein D
MVGIGKGGKPVQQAVESCKTQGINVDDHFREVTKMVILGSGAKRESVYF